MKINWKKVKVAKPEDPIYKEGFTIYPINSLNDYKKQREKQGMKNLFLKKIDRNASRDEMLDTLVKQLQKQGFNIVNKKGDKKFNYLLKFLLKKFSKGQKEGGKRVKISDRPRELFFFHTKSFSEIQKKD